MSLIEEALKRQQQESSGGGAAVPPVKPPETEKKEPSRALPKVAVVLVVLLIVLLAGLFLVYSAFRQLGQIGKETAEASPQEAPAALVQETAQAGPAAPPAVEPEQAQRPQAAAVTQQPEPQPSQVPVAPPAPDTAGPSAPPAPEPVAAAAEPEAEKGGGKATQPQPRLEPVVWPKVAVTGIVQNPRYASAQINGKVLGLGESADGITLVSVENQGAWLEFQGDRKFYKVRAGP